MIKLPHTANFGAPKKESLMVLGKLRHRFQVLPLLIFILVREGMCTLYGGSIVLEKAPASLPSPSPCDKNLFTKRMYVYLV